MSNTVLVTGFEPFGGESVNPSAQIAETLHGHEIRGHRIESRVLPVAFAGALDLLLREVALVEPSAVICLGQAGGEDGIRVERVAINLMDARIPDNAGDQPAGQRIDDDGPVEYRSSLPVEAIVSSIVAARIPAQVSYSAGTFVCNHVFYGLMRSLATGSGPRGGFVHVPFLPEQVRDSGAIPSMPLEAMVAAIRIAIDASLGV